MKIFCNARRILCAAMLITILICLVPALNAQSTTQGALAGTVLDGSGAVIPGATVTIQNKATGFSVNVIADSSG